MFWKCPEICNGAEDPVSLVLVMKTQDRIPPSGSAEELAATPQTDCVHQETWPDSRLYASFIQGVKRSAVYFQPFGASTGDRTIVLLPVLQWILKWPSLRLHRFVKQVRFYRSLNRNRLKRVWFLKGFFSIFVSSADVIIFVSYYISICDLSAPGQHPILFNLHLTAWDVESHAFKMCIWTTNFCTASEGKCVNRKSCEFG